MLFNMIKEPGGTFVPAHEMDLPALQKFKNGEMYELEIKRHRNPAFHRKVFAFFEFCFQYWSADKTGWKYFDERSQFDSFRKDLTILAGYKVITYNLDGSFKIEAKSLKFGQMEQDEFEKCYSALINAALENVFCNTSEQKIIDQLYSFF